MAAPTKNQKIEALVKLVQKRSRGAGLTPPPQRTVLETLMYAALLENASFDKADIAYTVLENYYIDWNEIRVCSVRELADTLMDLPHPEAAAERVRQALQGIFEKIYVFDLDEMLKKGKALAEHIKTLESMSAGTPYMIQYTAQVALDGHLIPFDEASLRIMRRLGLSQVSNEGTQEICTGLDRVILKKSGLTFASQLHHFAAGYYDVPDSPELLSQLSAIDPEAVKRSWASPILTSPSSPKEAITPISAPVSATASAPKQELSKQEIPVKKPVKPASEPKPAPKPVPKPASKPIPKKVLAKPLKKPAKKPMPVKSAAKPKQPVKPNKPIPSSKSAKPSVNVKKASLARSKAHAGKTMPGKRAVLSKKPAKPVSSKTKVPPKRGSAKPVKPLRGISPSKSLRKKKPK
jgi:endonuclease-3